jgi:hypothetical protein
MHGPFEVLPGVRGAVPSAPRDAGPLRPPQTAGRGPDRACLPASLTNPPAEEGSPIASAFIEGEVAHVFRGRETPAP